MRADATEASERSEEMSFTVEVAQTGDDSVGNILTTDDELDADAFSLAGRSRSLTGKTLFGSISQDVFIESDRRYS